MEIQLPAALETKLTRLAAQKGSDAVGLVVEAVERMVDHEEWFFTEVDKGLAQIENGQTLSHEEVGTRLERYLAAKQQVV
jgi:predicted transcriptional regulator